MRLAVATSLILASLALSACGGGEDPTGPEIVPAAGRYAQTDDSTPGVPAGASYDVTAVEWLKLPEPKRLAAAEAYVGDNEDECGNADAGRVRDYADVSAGADYPLTAPMAELLAEGCAAVLQSGSSSGD